jgi:hypothetical protein
MFVCGFVCAVLAPQKMSPRTTVRLSYIYCIIPYRVRYGTVLYGSVRYGTVPGTPRSGATGVQQCSARSAANKSDVTNTAPRDASQFICLKNIPLKFNGISILRICLILCIVYSIVKAIFFRFYITCLANIIQLMIFYCIVHNTVVPRIIQNKSLPINLTEMIEKNV